METRLLDEDLVQEDQMLVPASKGIRLANYLIDYFLVMGIVFGFSYFFYVDDSSFMSNIIYMVLYALYYIIIETALQGKSIGKLITGTRAVNTDGSNLEFNTVVKRSLCRLVPFEALSFLGDKANGWHDKWSDKIVIDEKSSGSYIG